MNGIKHNNSPDFIKDQEKKLAKIEKELENPELYSVIRISKENQLKGVKATIMNKEVNKEVTINQSEVSLPSKSNPIKPIINSNKNSKRATPNPNKTSRLIKAGDKEVRITFEENGGKYLIKAEGLGKLKMGTRNTTSKFTINDESPKNAGIKILIDKILSLVQDTIK